MNEIKKIDHIPFDGFEALLEESKREGFRFVERLKADWENGKNRFDKTGEVLFGVFEDKKCIAIGGINHDAYVLTSNIGRVRRFYVLQNWRRKGVGNFLLEKIIEYSITHFSKMRLRTNNPKAAKFYEGFGFVTVQSETATHELKMNDWHKIKRGRHRNVTSALTK